jgi:hypothetical protein
VRQAALGVFGFGPLGGEGEGGPSLGEASTSDLTGAVVQMPLVVGIHAQGEGLLNAHVSIIGNPSDN